MTLGDALSLSGWGGQPVVDMENDLLSVNRSFFPLACTSAGNYEPIQRDALDPEEFFCLTPMGKLIPGTRGYLDNPFNVSADGLVSVDPTYYSHAVSSSLLLPYFRCSHTTTFNFMRQDVEVPFNADWVVDVGMRYNPSKGYGWDANMGTFGGLPTSDGDLLYTTGILLPAKQQNFQSTWRYSVPAGAYVVSFSVGKTTSSRNTLYANGMPLILDYVVGANERFLVTDVVFVHDG